LAISPPICFMLPKVPKARVMIYDCNRFIIQATGCAFTKPLTNDCFATFCNIFFLIGILKTFLTTLILNFPRNLFKNSYK
jgi:hypothetical protein